MTTEPESRPAAEPVPDFRLQFTSTGGAPLGDGLYEYTTVLNMQGGARPRALMLLNRHNGDLIGKPIGTFSDMVPAPRARQVAKAVEDLIAKGMPQATGGDARANTLKLEYSEGKRKFTATLNAMDRSSLAALAAVMTELQPVMLQLLNRPERAVTVSVERLPDAPDAGGGNGGIKFQLKLTNVGIHEVLVGDPRIPARAGQKPRAIVRVAATPVKKPGFMDPPLYWDTVRLELPPAGTLDTGIVIKPGDTLSVATMPWIPPKPGEYVVQGVFQDGSGAGKTDPTKLQPAIPTDAAPDAKLLMLRGMAFSKYAKVTAAGR